MHSYVLQANTHYMEVGSYQDNAESEERGKKKRQEMEWRESKVMISLYMEH